MANCGVVTIKPGAEHTRNRKPFRRKLCWGKATATRSGGIISNKSPGSGSTKSKSKVGKCKNVLKAEAMRKDGSGLKKGYRKYKGRYQKCR